MADTKTASPERKGEYTEPKRCDGCKRAFWTKASWDRVWVKCPHCGHVH